MRMLLIVLSFNGASDTIACLRSIYRDKPAAADLLVVDNASGGETVADLRRAFPDAEILELADNRGWAGGNNAGIRVALDRGYDLVCLMNNDLCVTPGALAGLLAAAELLEPALLHPAIYYFDEPDRAQLDPSSGAQPLPGHTSLYELDFAYGACLVVHRAVFQRIGLLDERFFLQLEETEFHRRAVAAGMRSLCQTAARVLHKESASIGKVSPLKTFYMTRNTLLLAEKHAVGASGLLVALRGLIWTLRRRAGHDRSLWHFARWLVSGDAHAVAARRGALDYVTRRFGRMSAASRAALHRADYRSRQTLRGGVAK